MYDRQDQYVWEESDGVHMLMNHEWPSGRLTVVTSEDGHYVLEWPHFCRMTPDGPVVFRMTHAMLDPIKELAVALVDGFHVFAPDDMVYRMVLSTNEGIEFAMSVGHRDNFQFYDG